MKLDVQTLAGKKSGSVDLDKAIFGQEPRKDILHRMVRYQLAKRQSGTHQVQERGDVSKTTKRIGCLLYTSPSPRDRQKSRMPSSA